MLHNGKWRIWHFWNNYGLKLRIFSGSAAFDFFFYLCVRKQEQYQKVSFNLMESQLRIERSSKWMINISCSRTSKSCTHSCRVHTPPQATQTGELLSMTHFAIAFSKCKNSDSTERMDQNWRQIMVNGFIVKLTHRPFESSLSIRHKKALVPITWPVNWSVTWLCKSIKAHTPLFLFQRVLPFLSRNEIWFL